VDFEYTAEQKHLRKAVREFAEAEIGKIACDRSKLAGIH
jgi:hypothetical protein